MAVFADGQSGDRALTRKLLGALPQQDATDGVVTRYGVEQIEDLLPSPNEVPLELGQYYIALSTRSTTVTSRGTLESGSCAWRF